MVGEVTNTKKTGVIPLRQPSACCQAEGCARTDSLAAHHRTTQQTHKIGVPRRDEPPPSGPRGSHDFMRLRQSETSRRGDAWERDTRWGGLFPSRILTLMSRRNHNYPPHYQPNSYRAISWHGAQQLYTSLSLLLLLTHLRAHKVKA